MKNITKEQLERFVASLLLIACLGMAAFFIYAIYALDQASKTNPCNRFVYVENFEGGLEAWKDTKEGVYYVKFPDRQGFSVMLDKDGNPITELGDGLQVLFEDSINDSIK